MQLSNIRSDVRFIVFGDSTNTLYGDTDLDRNLNFGYRNLINLAMSVNGDWQVKGTVATTNIVADQVRYAVPSDILRINRLQIKSVSGNDYVVATKIDNSTIDEDLANYTPSPPEFDLRDNYFDIYIPESSITDVTAGLKLHYQKDITALSADSDSPDLPEFAVEFVSYYASHKYFVANEQTTRQREVERKLAELKEQIKEHYSNRMVIKQIKLTPKEENYY